MIINVNNISFNADHQTGMNGDWDFWGYVNDGSWEPHTFKVFDRFLDKDHSMIDIGCWIGPTCLYGSRLAKHVYGFEPDLTAYHKLQDNLSLNPDIKNIGVYPIAVGPTTGKVIMGSNSVPGDSMSSMLFRNQGWEVDSLTLNDVFDRFGITDCNFIKIDVEGSELLILPKIKSLLNEKKPTLYLALHTAWIEDQKSFLDMVKDVLSVYKNIYNNVGTKISLNDIDSLPKFTEVLATDLEW